MNRNVLLMICAVVVILKSTASQNPENLCLEVGQKVCVNCHMQGECVTDSSVPNGFTVRNVKQCPSDYFCDNTLSPSSIGVCARYNPTLTACAFHGDSLCIQDPNNENVYIKCDDPNYTTTGGVFYCDPADVVLNTCECSEDLNKSLLKSSKTATETPCPESCPFLPVGDGCPYFIECNDDLFGQCPDSYCFDQDKCECISYAVTTPLPCPDGCTFVKDPSDNCTKYYECTDYVNIPYECPNSKCFDQDSCGCVENSQKRMTFK